MSQNKNNQNLFLNLTNKTINKVIYKCLLKIKSNFVLAFIFILLLNLIKINLFSINKNEEI